MKNSNKFILLALFVGAIITLVVAFMKINASITDNTAAFILGLVSSIQIICLISLIVVNWDKVKNFNNRKRS